MRHAFLMIAHKEVEPAAGLLPLLDNERDATFPIADQKAAFSDKDKYMLHASVKKSELYLREKTAAAQWETYSQIQAELLLLTSAVEHGPFGYYHLLSGQNLPIKTQDEIHAFCKKNSGCEFVSFESKKMKQLYGCQFYYDFFEAIPKPNSKWVKEKSSLWPKYSAFWESTDTSTIPTSSFRREHNGSALRRNWLNMFYQRRNGAKRRSNQIIAAMRYFFKHWCIILLLQRDYFGRNMIMTPTPSCA